MRRQDMVCEPLSIRHTAAGEACTHSAELSKNLKMGISYIARSELLKRDPERLQEMIAGCECSFPLLTPSSRLKGGEGHWSMRC